MTLNVIENKMAMSSALLRLSFEVSGLELGLSVHAGKKVRVVVYTEAFDKQTTLADKQKTEEKIESQMDDGDGIAKP